MIFSFLESHRQAVSSLNNRSGEGTSFGTLKGGTYGSCPVNRIFDYLTYILVKEGVAGLVTGLEVEYPSVTAMEGASGAEDVSRGIPCGKYNIVGRRKAHLNVVTFTEKITDTAVDTLREKSCRLRSVFLLSELIPNGYSHLIFLHNDRLRYTVKICSTAKSMCGHTKPILFIISQLSATSQ